MFEKIKWKEHNFYYTFDTNEPVFSPDYFQFYNGKVKSIEPVKLEGFSIRVIANNELIIKGPFYEGYYVVINNIEYPYYENDEEEKPEEPEEPEEEIKEPEGIVEVFDDEVYFYFEKLPEDFEEDYVQVKVKVDEYTNEVYPDHPFRSKTHSVKLNKFHKYYFLKKERNVIYQITILMPSNEKYFIEKRSDILCYFSTVESLKTFIKDLELNIPIKDDEELRKLIQEKSVKLKRRFGLREKYTENPEYFPAFKRVVNLYCVEDLISVSFINGNFITTGNKGTNNGLELSKFKVDGDGGNNGYALSTDLIKTLITEAENDLYKSLFKEPINKKKNGAFKCYQR